MWQMKLRGMKSSTESKARHVSGSAPSDTGHVACKVFLRASWLRRSFLASTQGEGSTQVVGITGNKKPALRLVFKGFRMNRVILRTLFGAPGETRTPTLLPTADFESAASTDSATEAWRAV